MRLIGGKYELSRKQKVQGTREEIIKSYEGNLIEGEKISGVIKLFIRPKGFIGIRCITGKFQTFHL